MAASSTKSPRAAGLSDPGRERDNNEDRTLCEPEIGLYAVIDGVGGESGGEVAADIACDTLKGRLSKRTSETQVLVREAIALANRNIFERARQNPALTGMACVLTVAVVENQKVIFGHVGDSRMYLLKRGQIRKLTRDHSPIGMREDQGELSEAEAMSHPRRNEIFRDVGSAPHETDEPGFIDVGQEAFPSDAALLLCSDGLTDMVPAQTILAIAEANAGDPRRTVRALIDAANAAGGKDNVSVVVVEGERYAASLKGDPASPRPRVKMQGAMHAKPGGIRRLFSAFASRPAVLLYGLILGALAYAAWAGALSGPPVTVEGDGRRPTGNDEIRVGTNERYTTIQSAVVEAEKGQTIVVTPGDYPESIVIDKPVRLVSEVPRGATILPPRGSDAPAVTFQGVRGASLIGVRIAGEPEAPLQIGLRLVNSAVMIEDVEITAAGTAAVEVQGADQSTVRYSHLHDNTGAGVRIDGRAETRLLHNLIRANGGPRSANAPPGVDVRGEARPLLTGNLIDANGGGGVSLPSNQREAEIRAMNSFNKTPEAQRVQVRPPSQPSQGTP